MRKGAGCICSCNFTARVSNNGDWFDPETAKQVDKRYLEDCAERLADLGAVDSVFVVQVL